MPKKGKEKGLVPIGKIVGAHGIQGRVKLLYFSNLKAFPYSHIHLQEADGTFRCYPVVASHPLKGTWALQLDGIESRTEALALRGRLAYCSRDAFPRTAPDEFYWIDLIGMTVREPSRPGTGRVKGLLETGGTDVLEIVWNGKEYLVPLSYHWVKEISLKEKRLILEEGTLEFFDVH
jgi:16S rRNA processing protein RimM